MGGRPGAGPKRTERYQMLLRSVLLAGLMLTLVFPSLAAGAQPATHKVEIKSVIERFIQSFNKRDVEAMLALYEEDAKISAKVQEKLCWISKDEYRDRLQKRLRGMEAKGVRIVGYKIMSLDYTGPDAAELTVAVKAQAGFINVVEKGKLTLAACDQGQWRIAVDEM